jgi:hypothetical protein
VNSWRQTRDRRYMRMDFTDVIRGLVETSEVAKDVETEL